MATRVDSLPIASPFVRLWLALGEPPTEVRIRGWVEASITGGTDNVTPSQLWQRYGPSLAAECLRANFTPAFLTPIADQSLQAQAAAKAWALSVVKEGAY